MKRNRYIGYIVAVVAMTTMAACSVIDDDLDDCDANFQLVYELRLITNMNTELTTELDEESDQWVATALKQYLEPIFTDYAYDVNLSFFDVEGDSAILHRETHIMDANQTSYTLYLPVRQYMHTAVANVMNNPLVNIRNNDQCHKGTLAQVANDTITPHTTGIFTARLPMDIYEHTDQTFSVHLYMANCATALVLDSAGVTVDNIEVYASGFATDYYLADSAYMFRRANTTSVHADHVVAEQGTKDCYCTVNYPSPEAPLTQTKERSRLIVDTEGPFLADKAEDALWRYDCYVTLHDGSTTRTELFVTLPLRAGQLKIIKGWVLENGSIRTNDNEIATSITIDWKSGLEIDSQR